MIFWLPPEKNQDEKFSFSSSYNAPNRFRNTKVVFNVKTSNTVRLPNHNMATPPPPPPPQIERTPIWHVEHLWIWALGIFTSTPPPPYKMCMCHITGIQNLVLPWRPPQVIQTELSNDCTSNYPHIWTKQVILSRQESNNFLLLAIQEMTFTTSKYSVVIARFSSNLHHKLFSFIFFSMFKLLVQKIIENCRHYPFK